MRPTSPPPSADTSADPHAVRRRRCAVTAVLSLVLSAGGGAIAHAAPATSTPNSTTWLSFTVDGADSSTRLYSSGVPGGGQLVSFFQQPATDQTSTDERDLTFHVDGKIVAARAASLSDGTMSPTADSDLEVTTKDGTSSFTVDSDDQAQTLYLLPAVAPKAADPDDQNLLEKLWGKVTGLIKGDDDDTGDSSTASDSADADPTSSPSTSSTPTGQKSSSPTSTAGSSHDGAATGDEEGNSATGTPTGTPTGSSTGTATSPSSSTSQPSSSSSSSSSSSGSSSRDCLATAGPVTDSTAASSRTNRSPQDSASSDRDASSGPTGPAAQPTTTPTSTSTDSALSKACAPSTGGDSGDQDGTQDSTDGGSQEGNNSSAGSGAGSGVSMQNQASGLPFMLGASGEGVADGSYAKALGRDVDIAATWANDNQNMVDLPQLQPGGEYADWTKALDISIGAIDQNAGETWAKAASGAYDDRWTESIENMKKLRAGATGDTYVRFAHEWNGSWFAWSVTAGDTENFKKAWQHFADLAHGIWPDVKLVMSQNRESNGYAGNWEDAFPGNQYVDALNVDYYNNWPFAASVEDFEADLDEKDGYGGPKGLNAHAEFAKSVGLSLSLGEWSGVQGDEGGDSPGFIEGSYDYFTRNAGTGPGQILYVCQFNVTSAGNGKFNLLMDSQQPKASEKFKELFGKAA